MGYTPSTLFKKMFLEIETFRFCKFEFCWYVMRALHTKALYINKSSPKWMELDLDKAE